MSRTSTKAQVSAGGVVYRRRQQSLQIILISVGEHRRWQLPKGLLKKQESPEQAALREVQEETGVQATLLAPIDQIDYWYDAHSHSQRVRFHKVVYFYLLQYKSGSTKNHDQEVNEACWVEIDQAQAMLTFKNEQGIIAKAKEMIKSFAHQGINEIHRA
jgi:8-oxo-dGTP diphosphatase